MVIGVAFEEVEAVVLVGLDEVYVLLFWLAWLRRRRMKTRAVVLPIFGGLCLGWGRTSLGLNITWDVTGGGRARLRSSLLHDSDYNEDDGKR